MPLKALSERAKHEGRTRHAVMAKALTEAAKAGASDRDLLSFVATQRRAAEEGREFGLSFSQWGRLRRHYALAVGRDAILESVRLKEGDKMFKRLGEAAWVPRDLRPPDVEDRWMTEAELLAATEGIALEEAKARLLPRYYMGLSEREQKRRRGDRQIELEDLARDVASARTGVPKSQETPDARLEKTIMQLAEDRARDRHLPLTEALAELLREKPGLYAAYDCQAKRRKV